MDKNFKALLFEKNRSASDLESGARQRSLPTQFLKAILKVLFTGYRWLLSPLMHALGGSGFGCRYEPTCSQYAQECFEKFSFFKALSLSIKRILRCNPWIKADAFDPVPGTRVPGTKVPGKTCCGHHHEIRKVNG